MFCWIAKASFTKFVVNATELSTASHVISEWHQKVTFDFTEIVNDRKMWQETECQIVKIIFHFSKLHIKISKYFQSYFICSVSSNYHEKSRVLNFLANIFC